MVDLLERYEAGRPHYDEFTERARRLLGSDEQFRAGRDRWRERVRASHGGALEAAAVDVDDLFVDSLYVTHVVDGVLTAVERTFAVRVTNRAPVGADRDASGSTGAVPDLRALHRRVGAESAVADGIDRDALARLDGTFVRDLYERVVEREVRLALGEYNTPPGLAALVVDALDVPPATATYLDPGCGTGTFLAACIDRKRAALADGGVGAIADGSAVSADAREDREDHPADPAAVLSAIVGGVHGVDLNPVAVRGAKLTYLLALGDLLDTAEMVTLPVSLADSLGLADREPADCGVALDGRVDALVGNPPWIPWGRLPERQRERWRARHVERLDLLPHDGASSRLGYANDDLAVLFTWVCAHRYLASGGQVGVVLKRSLSKGPAGALLRSGRVGDRALALRRVHAFEDVRPFGRQVGPDAAVYVLAADGEPSFPVPVTVWQGDGTPPDFSTLRGLWETLRATETAFVPVDEEPGAAWIRADAERRALGDCSHEIRHGVKDDASAVFGLDRATLGRLEPDRVFPYLKSRHVVPYGVFGHDLRLVPVEKAGVGDEATLAERYPRTYDYLDGHRERLADRASSWFDGGPFFDVFGVGPYTWADYKVVWCRLGWKPHFAVVSTADDPDLGEKPLVPGDHYMFVPFEDERPAHFLCALLNSAPYRRSLSAVAGRRKSSLSASVVEQLRLPPWRDAPEQRSLAALSARAHDIVGTYADRMPKREYLRTATPDLDAVQADVDRQVEDLLAAADR